ncbi:hypothetical protein [Microbacterium azadirachtae]|uniref:Uncharacterized protein n=1 Tax=Microbacterium azadirachtae TaxID=582680 RepID=A0A0F0LR95_9MICO|nr:hypothetical protein [Microbacterium azadirachtae]KJL35209.1 hypothetical protein RL72_00025 [Microbacterium azadirachtae]UXW85334.1 hypothetical protein NFX31_14115 [Microbacterium azadirachtae]SDM45793.1 hypothetical protein SAMN04488593_3618 [Microbacterium azadirachtae]SEG55924.1 hypothetical protein SAMN04488594_3471 [Microbacterium azadirachtae]SEG58727.1 hypothetical protein SAMN04488592_3482 [Microbacterium azadirachtae]
MTTPRAQLSPVPARQAAACMCDHGDVCSSFAPGHALHLIQARLAAATTAGWTDALVTGLDRAAGIVQVQTLEGEILSLWNAGGAALEVEPGQPVAVHTRWNVLAIGALRYNVARA